MDDDRIRSVLVKRYEILEKIGEGAMGQVYRAKDLRLGSIVAVKFLAHALQSSEMCDRFAMEAKACAQLDSNFIVKVTDYGVDKQGVPFYVMEYLEGQILKDVLKTQALSLPRFFNLSQQICLGLQAAHQGIRLGNGDNLYPIIHCDIKPSNILVIPDALLGERAKVLDFGIAKVMTGKTKTVGFSGGTLQYCSPEQMEGQEELTPRSDIYSLGVVMFEMLTGRLPLRPRNNDFGGWFRAHYEQPPAKFSAIAPHLEFPQGLEALVLRFLEKSPQNRPGSVEEILQSLKAIGQPYGAYQSAFSAPIPQPLPVEPAPDVAKKLHEANPLATFPKNISLERVLVQPLSMNQETLAIVGRVLPEAVIRRLQIHQLYNIIEPRFIHIPYSYPLLLWLTVAYTPGFKFIWIPYYLDLKKEPDQEIIRLLCQKERYQWLLFERKEPYWCSHSVSISLRSGERSRLQQWAIAARSQVAVGSPQASKKLLETEYQRLKPIIEQEIRDR